MVGEMGDVPRTRPTKRHADQGTKLKSWGDSVRQLDWMRLLIASYLMYWQFAIVEHQYHTLTN
ncbi:hypothetical protein DSO57_1018092 [Entomophthora muscae]|uniref:Uncharacterized protein n=1 Tax=Entomophthora muscae TaxID=34485 RepID=A0ACC2TRY6_9FUNG|nr:hypothetical protein DSO57_1018092 [Entomophthora muscae]